MGEKKLKILQVHNYYQIPGGEDTVVANEKKLLEDHGHIVIQYTRNNSELKDMSKARKLLLPFTTIFNPKTYRDVKRIIKEDHIDIVHVHNTLNLISPAVYYAALKCKVPVVQTVHNFRLLCPGATFYRDGHICEDCVEHGLHCAIKHSCYRGSKVQTLVCVVNTWIHRKTQIYGKINYICLTEFNKEKLLQLNRPGRKNLIDPEKVFIKPNFTYDTAHEEFGGGYREYYLFIGRIEKIKGMDVLLDAFAMLPDLKLVIAGTGSQLEEYKHKATGNVYFAGFLNRAELSDCLTKTKAVIVPSQWYETFGMIIAEAYVAHRPVIAGNIGNIGALVEEETTGLHFDYNSSESLRSAVFRLENMDTGSMEENAYGKYEREFTPEINYSVLKRIYESVI